MVTLILQRYLLKELGRAFLLAFVCFELFMFLGISVQLIHKGLDIINLRPLIPYVLLYACPYSLPAALLTATVVAYGRLCADNEISAIKTCGIHLRTIIIPIIFVGIIFSLLTLYLNAKVLPKAYYWVQMLQEQAVKQILAGRTQHRMKNKISLEPYHIYIGSVEGTTYKDLIVIEYMDDYVTNVLIAKEGTINVKEQEDIVMLTLRNGEFFKPNYRKPEDIPKTGNFEETTFEIPLQIKISERSKKYLTLPQLFALRKKITEELGDPRELFKYPKQVKKKTIREVLTLDSKLKQLLEEQEITAATIKDASENITKQATKADALKEEIRLSEQYIARVKTNIEQIMQELKTKKEGQHLDGIRLFEDIIEEGDDDGTEKIAQINERILMEQQRIQEALRHTSALEKLQEQEKAKIESATSSLNALNKQENELREKRTNLVAHLEKAKKQELQHETSITIHKRISPSLSCLVFVLIGIPLGIKTRCGNILISIGISFLLVLVLYYPLVMLGWVLAEDLTLPVIPAVWGANMIVGVVGIIFFQQVFRK